MAENVRHRTCSSAVTESENKDIMEINKGQLPTPEGIGTSVHGVEFFAKHANVDER